MPSTDPNVPDSETTVTTPKAGGEVVERWLQAVVDADQRDADAANARLHPPPK